MTLDEIEKLARGAFADGAYGPMHSGPREQDLARALLLAIPVLRAAVAWMDDKSRARVYAWEHTVIDLANSIAQMRRSLEQP